MMEFKTRDTWRKVKGMDLKGLHHGFWRVFLVAVGSDGISVILFVVPVLLFVILFVVTVQES